MKYAVVECLLRLNQGGNPNLIEVSKTGPDALCVTEIPILRQINDVADGGAEDCCISDVRQVRTKEISRNLELERLRDKYGSDIVNMIYPGGRGLPVDLSDLELPEEAMGAPRKKKEAA